MEFYNTDLGEDAKDKDEERDAGESIVLPVTPPKKVVCIKVDADLLNYIDEFWRRRGYSSRSAFLREAIIIAMQVIESDSEHKRSAELAEARDADISPELYLS